MLTSKMELGGNMKCSHVNGEDWFDVYMENDQRISFLVLHGRWIAQKTCWDSRPWKLGLFFLILTLEYKLCVATEFMIKIYSRLDTLLNMSFCVHLCFCKWTSNLLVWGVQRLVIYNVSNCSGSLRVEGFF